MHLDRMDADVQFLSDLFVCFTLADGRGDGFFLRGEAKDLASVRDKIRIGQEVLCRPIVDPHLAVDNCIECFLKLGRVSGARNDTAHLLKENRSTCLPCLCVGLEKEQLRLWIAVRGFFVDSAAIDNDYVGLTRQRLSCVTLVTVGLQEM